MGGSLARFPILCVWEYDPWTLVRETELGVDLVHHGYLVTIFEFLG